MTNLPQILRFVRKFAFQFSAGMILLALAWVGCTALEIPIVNFNKWIGFNAAALAIVMVTMEVLVFTGKKLWNGIARTASSVLEDVSIKRSLAAELAEVGHHEPTLIETAQTACKNFWSHATRPGWKSMAFDPQAETITVRPVN